MCVMENSWGYGMCDEGLLGWGGVAYVLKDGGGGRV